MKTTKYILLTFLSLIISLPIFAQRLNEHGLKMVSEVEFKYPHSSLVDIIKFKYNEQNRLTQMSVYRKWIYTDEDNKRLNYMSPQERKEHLEEFPSSPKLYRDFIKDDNGLTVKDYDSYNYSPLRWEVAFDCYENISSISVFEEFEPGAIKRDEFNFEYERDGIENSFRISRYSHTETSKRNGQKSWYGTTVGTLYRDVFYYDGFIHTDCFPSQYEQLKETIDYNHINDTNINLVDIISGVGSLYGGGLNWEYFTLTEWLPCRSKYFVKLNNDKYDRHEYIYDERGNLTEIRTFTWGKWEKLNGEFGWGVEKSIKLKYVY